MTLLQGRVYESTSGRPIEGVFVSLGGQYGGATDANGNFSIDAPIGSYTLTMTHRDFAPYSTMILLNYDMNMGIIPLRQTRVRAL